MKLVTYEAGGRKSLGVMSRDGQWIYPLKAAGMDYTDMMEIIKGLGESEKELLEHISGMDPYSLEGAARIDEVKILSPIERPEQDIICLGLNYLEHAKESARYKEVDFGGKREQPVYFSKRVNETVGPDEPIPSHSDLVDSLDYEAELAVIIGKDAKNVKKEEVKNYIFGYTIVNDVSARNVQNAHKQWYFGKSLDGFTPLGPCILTVESVDYPPKLAIQSKVNGELRQNSNTDQMIFDIDFIVSQLSQGMTLKAGTIISTGTPAGAGMGFIPPRFLKSGDEVECIIEEIGILRNRVE